MTEGDRTAYGMDIIWAAVQQVERAYNDIPMKQHIGQAMFDMARCYEYCDKYCYLMTAKNLDGMYLMAENAYQHLLLNGYGHIE